MDSFEITLTAETENNIVVYHCSHLPFGAFVRSIFGEFDLLSQLSFVLVEISGFRLKDSHPNLTLLTIQTLEI